MILIKEKPALSGMIETENKLQAPRGKRWLIVTGDRERLRQTSTGRGVYDLPGRAERLWTMVFKLREQY